MSLTLALVLGLAAPAAQPGTTNLDFASGKLTHWEGEGFSALRHSGQYAVSSAGREGRAVLHRTFYLPANASAVQFSAAVYRPDGAEAGGALDVMLEASRREFLPRQVLQGGKWVAASEVLPPDLGRLRTYRWEVDAYAGRQVRIAVFDQDARPGCHIVCSGFRVVTRDEINSRLFSDDMANLQTRHKVARVYRYDSKHFMAFSNADAGYTEYRLYNCETIYPLFFSHFRDKGFAVQPPAEKMMVAIFDAQEGVEAYLGQKLSTAVTGLYHPESNRLLVYDYARNRDFARGKKRIEDMARLGNTDLERERRIVTFGRFVRDRQDDTNISTIMHEVAHQLSYNGGMCNRKGDVPVWLAEGLAVYCEPTVNASWQGIGEANPSRANVLASVIKSGGEFIPLRELVSGDGWIRGPTTVGRVVLGYSQSWALFRLLMEERPRQLKAYLKLIYPRKTPDYRLVDFGEAFGSDLPKLDRRYRAYLREIARKEARTGK